MFSSQSHLKYMRSQSRKQLENISLSQFSFTKFQQKPKHEDQIQKLFQVYTPQYSKQRVLRNIEVEKNDKEANKSVIIALIHEICKNMLQFDPDDIVFQEFRFQLKYPTLNPNIIDSFKQLKESKIQDTILAQSKLFKFSSEILACPQKKSVELKRKKLHRAYYTCQQIQISDYNQALDVNRYKYIVDQILKK
eukprot:EST44627.1 Hypothetical protein SS50377_15634 [Spironucleus salmonicida]